MPTQDMVRRHAALVDHMAQTVGVDLDEQSMRGAITASEIDDAILACTGCTQPETCKDWLSQQTGTANAPPSFCRNTQLFEALKP